MSLSIVVVEAADRENLTAVAIQPLLNRHQLAGAVTLVVSKDKVRSLETVGYADVAAGHKMEPSTLFWMASSSKPFLAIAVMMLADEGKIRLDDPVERYLPEFHPRVEALTQDGRHVVLQKPAHTITVRSLLNHTSGTSFLSSLEHGKIDALPSTARIDVYNLEPLEFAPDTKWNYSQAGFETAARIIEVISGMPFETFMRRRLFEPLGMVDTTYLPTDAQVARLAKPYKGSVDGASFEEVPIFYLQYPLANNPKRFPAAGGGLFSTAPDLARFCRMLLNGGTLEGKRYLSEAAIQEMTRNQIRPELLQDNKLEGGWDNYGLAWQLINGTYGHEGAYGTNIKFYPKAGIAVVWLVQTPDPLGVGRAGRSAFEKLVEAAFVSVVK